MTASERVRCPKLAPCCCSVLHPTAALQLAGAVARSEQVAVVQAQALPDPERSLSEHCPHIRCWLVHSSLQILLLDFG